MERKGNILKEKGCSNMITWDIGMKEVYGKINVNAIHVQ